MAYSYPWSPRLISKMLHEKHGEVWFSQVFNSLGQLYVSIVALVKFCVCPSFPFGIKGGMWDVIVLIPNHCLSIYFKQFYLY